MDEENKLFCILFSVNCTHKKNPVFILCAQYVLTGRYGAKAPQDSATNNLRSGYLWLIFRERERERNVKRRRGGSAERNTATESERRREVDWRAATAE